MHAAGREIDRAEPYGNRRTLARTGQEQSGDKRTIPSRNKRVARQLAQYVVHLLRCGMRLPEPAMGSTRAAAVGRKVGRIRMANLRAVARLIGQPEEKARRLLISAEN